MYHKKINGPSVVSLPDGTRLTMADLPPVDTRRWVASRKAKVLLAIAAGLISADQAIQMYRLSSEELESWKSAIMKHGQGGLKVTHLKKYRQP